MMNSEKGLAFSNTLTVRKAEEVSQELLSHSKYLKNERVFYSSYMVERGSQGDLNIDLSFQFLTWTAKT